jgi:hypothetical protein
MQIRLGERKFVITRKELLIESKDKTMKLKDLFFLFSIITIILYTL